jgi:hypothetical protein
MSKIISISLFTIGIIFFLIGFHNIDNAFNMGLLEEWEYEMFLNGEIRDMKDTYLIGLRMLFIGFTFLVVSFLLLLKSKTERKNIKSIINKLSI